MRFVLWPNTCLILDNVPYALEENVYSAYGDKMFCKYQFYLV